MCVKNFGGGNANGLNVDWDVTRRCSSTNLTIHDISHVPSSWILNLGSVGLFYPCHAPLAERGIWEDEWLTANAGDPRYPNRPLQEYLQPREFSRPKTW